MAEFHYSERIRAKSDDERRAELLRNDPNLGASPVVRNEIARRDQARSVRNTRIFMGIGIVTVLIAALGIVIGL